VTQKKTRSDQAADLRRRAEKEARADVDNAQDSLSPAEVRQVLHEQRVHQIELEMQNEELRRAQAELEASRARYFDLYDLAPVGYVTLSEKGLILEANLTAASLLGVARGALVKQPLPRFILPEDQNIYYRHCQQLFEAGAPQVCELRMMKKNGIQFWARLEATAAEDANGTPVCRTVLSDITARKQADSLRRSEQLYRSLVENIDAGITLMDSSHTIVAINSGQSRMFGKDAAEFIGKKCYREFEKRDAVCDHCPGVTAMAIHESAEVETEGVRDDGSRFPARVRAFPLFGPDGAATGFIELVEDISERRQVEQRLRTYADELEATNKALEESKHRAECANRAKSEFLTNMSHEIRTPMTAILGFADLMLDENVGRATREHVAVIKRSGEHLLRLIDDILDLSKIEAGKLQIEPTRCSPVQVVAEVVSLMRPQAAAKQLTLKTQLAHPLPETVLTDPLRLRQVLVNLVGNAIKFTNQGEVRLAVRLNADSSRLSLRFDVSDTGIGMNEEEIGGLFKPFSQADNSSTRKFGGTGLGLCISKCLAEALGGDIEVRSEPGKGSTFSLTIDPGPLEGVSVIEDAQEAATEPPPAAKPADADKIALCGRILVAEDMMENQRLICLLLRNAGAQVSAVDNGQLAVETAQAAHDAGGTFDVVLMDMQMPVMDGYEATRQLRKRGYTGPIVALTAHAMVEDCQKCLAAGCNDYLPKPFQHRALLEMVARHITAGEVAKPLVPDDARPLAASGRTHSDSPDSSASENPTARDNAPAFVAGPPSPETLVKAN
jgi:two-component system, sensor histidine kinase